MKTTKIEGILTAMSPLHHGGDEKTGSEIMIRRIKYLVGDQMAEVPVISGNAIRGPLRRAVFHDLCQTVGYEPSMKVYYTLFAGGILEDVGGLKGHIDLAMREEMRRVLPPISLLGASIFNQILAGKLQVGIATPVCSELNAYHPDHLHSELSFYELLDDAFHTRRDDLGAKRGGESEDTIQMMYTFETLAPGTRLYHSLTLLDCTELEESCLHHIIDLWKRNPRIGGKSSTGFGQIKIEYDWPEGFPDSVRYSEYVISAKKEILQLFSDLEEAFSAVKKRKKAKTKKKTKATSQQE